MRARCPLAFNLKLRFDPNSRLQRALAPARLALATALVPAAALACSAGAGWQYAGLRVDRREEIQDDGTLHQLSKVSIGGSWPRVGHHRRGRKGSRRSHCGREARTIHGRCAQCLSARTTVHWIPEGSDPILCGTVPATMCSARVVDRA